MAALLDAAAAKKVAAEADLVLQQAEYALLEALARVRAARTTQTDGQAGSDAALEVYRVRLLSTRQREVLVLMAEGLSYGEMGERLIISRHTARTHGQNILAKLNVSTQLAAIRIGQRHGIVPVPVDRRVRFEAAA